MRKVNTIILFILLLFVAGCKSCSHSGQKLIREQGDDIHERYSSANDNRGKSVVYMHEVNGVYEIPVEINNIPLNFIFDTGASSISISATEAGFLLKNGYLKPEDILGSQQFTDATGRISEGTIINLRKVTIGGRNIYNIQASVVNNSEAPLLLGQTALSRFGRINIDYGKKVISFEN